ncbi:NAD(P)-dependent oxidoreductase [Ferroglobus sp.]|uniref:NAD-dependent epimerase/dehydratase family protein n=1 Tax=Ferroglobus sp. TaxID=2614230 RepID=UPI0025BEAADF|nr:NAD-dependent epimerase/dehydratase family protein [Ferroglobus sp.]
MKVGITGAGGYVGAGLSAKLMEKGYEVVMLDNFFNAQVRSVHGQEIIWVDILDRNDLEDHLKDCDIVVHLAAISGVVDCEKYPDKAYEVNVIGTANTAWICRKYGIDMIFASSMAVIGDPKQIPIKSNHPREPLNVYGFTKAVGEEIVRTFSNNSFNALIFVKSNLYGVYELDGEKISKRTVINIFVDRAKKGENLTVHKPGTQSRDFIHILDVIDAYVLAIERMPDGFNIVTLGSGESLSVLDIANLVKKISPNPIDIKLVDNPRSRETHVENFIVDTSEAEKLIGFKAKRKVEDEIKSLLKEI